MGKGKSEGKVSAVLTKEPAELERGASARVPSTSSRTVIQTRPQMGGGGTCFHSDLQTVEIKVIHKGSKRG